MDASPPSQHSLQTSLITFFEIFVLFCLLDGKWLQHFVFLAGLDSCMLWVPYETNLKRDQGISLGRPRIERASLMPYAFTPFSKKAHGYDEKPS